MANVQLTDEVARLGIAYIAEVASLAQGAKADTALQPVAGKGLSSNDYTDAEKDKLAGIADAATANSSDATLLNRANHTGVQVVATVTGLQAALDGKATAAQGAKADTAVQPGTLAAVATAGTYASLTGKPSIPAAPGDIGAATAAQGAKADTALQPAAIGTTVASLVGGTVPSSQLPSYVDDVLEFANLAALPATGESGKIYITLDTNFEYRWSGSTYVRLVASPGTTDALVEGTTNLYFLAARVLAAVLTGLSLATGTPVTAADTVLVAIGKLQNQITARLPIVAAFTNALISGTNASSTFDVSAAPSGNSTQVLIGRRTQINFNSALNMLTGGYLCAEQDVINTAGTGTHDKVVARMAQLNLTGGNVAAAVGMEAVISTVGLTTTVNGAAGFLFANHRAVANINNIGTLAAVSNQDPVALIVSAGPFVNSDLRELAPSRAAGLVSGRYYSAPLKTMTQNVVAASVIYVTYVYIPRRCTPVKLGCNVTTAAAGNVILGLYKVKDNQLTTLVSQTASISTATTGAKEGTVSTQVDSGVYAIVAVFSGIPTISFHEINTNDMIGASSPTGYSEQAFISPFTFGALPATANILPTFAANTIEPHLYFGV